MPSTATSMPPRQPASTLSRRAKRAIARSVNASARCARFESFRARLGESASSASRSSRAARSKRLESALGTRASHAPRSPPGSATTAQSESFAELPSAGSDAESSAQLVIMPTTAPSGLLVSTSSVSMALPALPSAPTSQSPVFGSYTPCVAVDPTSATASGSTSETKTPVTLPTPTLATVIVYEMPQASPEPEQATTSPSEPAPSPSPQAHVASFVTARSDPPVQTGSLDGSSTFLHSPVSSSHVSSVQTSASSQSFSGPRTQ